MLAVPSNLYKNQSDDKIWWKDNSETYGVIEFTFDKVKFFNLFRDYPHNLTKEQRRIFDSENPYWVKFFSDRLT